MIWVQELRNGCKMWGWAWHSPLSQMDILVFSLLAKLIRKILVPIVIVTSKPEWYCDGALFLYLPPQLKLAMDAVESSVSRDLFQRKVFHCTKSSNFKAKFYSKAVVRANTHCIKCNCLWTIETLSLVKHLTFPNSDCNRLVTIFIIPDLVCSISLLSPPDSTSFLSLLSQKLQTFLSSYLIIRLQTF